MSVKVSHLPSGLTIISDSMPDVASISMGLWFGVGTRFETPTQAGLSHLLEHMFFKGSITRDAKTLNRAIENVGGSLNAYTTREQTAYTGRVLSADLPLATELLADMLLQPKLDPGDIEKEKSVIAQEIGEAYDAPDDWIFDLFHLTAYPDQPLGQPVLGSPETLAGITDSVLRDYIATHYRAQRCVLAAAGALEHQQLVKLAEQHFARLPPGDPVACAPAHYRGGDALENRDIEQLHLCFGLEAVPATHPLFHAQALFSLALGGGTSSRLFHEVREERALAYSVSAFTSPYQECGLFMIYAAADPARAQEASNLILHETTTLAKTITAEELERSKALARASLLMELESTSARAERAAHTWLTHSRIISTQDILSKIEAVTLADIAAISAKLLASPLTRTAVGPVAALEPFATTQGRLAA
jgi:predicted Zn-dependent peptidase